MKSPSQYSFTFVAFWIGITLLGGAGGLLLTVALGGEWLVGLAMGIVAGNLLAIAGYLWRARPPVIKSLPEINVRLLGWVLALTSAGSAAYLLAGWAGVPVNIFFPWDGLALLATSFAAELLRRRGRSMWAASALMSILFLPIAFNAQLYGMSSPVNGAYIIGLIISGLVLGSNGFLGALAAMATLTALFAVAEQTGRWTPLYPVGTPARTVVLVLFWWSLYGAGAWLSWLFTRALERALQASQGQTMALARTFKALTPSATLDTLLAQTLATLAELFESPYAQLWLLVPGGAVLQLRATYPASETGEPPVPIDRSPLWRELLQSRRPIAVDDCANDPRPINRAGLMARGVRAALYVPLLTEDSLGGVFALSYPARQRWQVDELELAQALAQQASLALRLSALADQTQQAAILEERNRMARDIHDTLAQGFTGIVIQLEAAEDAAASESAGAVQQHLARARALARDSLAEARRSVHALKPAALEHKPLPAAMRDSVAALVAATGLQVTWESPPAWQPLAAELEADLLRLAQEAVTNALRHAQATQLLVALHQTHEQVTLTVQDNGAGFDPAQIAGGYGQTAMRQRALRHGGQFSLTTELGAGTTVECRIPRHGPRPALRESGISKDIVQTTSGE